jgi:hypothetical protein
MQVKDLPSAVLYPTQAGDGEVHSLKDV